MHVSAVNIALMDGLRTIKGQYPGGEVGGELKTWFCRLANVETVYKDNCSKYSIPSVWSELIPALCKTARTMNSEYTHALQ